MDTWLAIASRREVRDYTRRPIPDEVVHRILDAGRLAGSSQNKQQWEFVVVSDKEALAAAVYAPGNVLGAHARRRDRRLGVPVRQGPRRAEHDARRLERRRRLVPERHQRRRSARSASSARRSAIVLTFGYPAKPRDPNARTAEEWSARAKRKPFDEVVRYV